MRLRRRLMTLALAGLAIAGTVGATPAHADTHASECKTTAGAGVYSWCYSADSYNLGTTSNLVDASWTTRYVPFVGTFDNNVATISTAVELNWPPGSSTNYVLGVKACHNTHSCELDVNGAANSVLPYIWAYTAFLDANNNVQSSDVTWY